MFIYYYSVVYLYILSCIIFSCSPHKTISYFYKNLLITSMVDREYFSHKLRFNMEQNIKTNNSI